MWRLSLLVVLWVAELHGAFEKLPEGGRAAAMGGVAVAVGSDPLALRANPSLAAWCLARSLSVVHEPAWMGVPELALSAFTYLEPLPVGTVGLSGSSFGFSLYRETTLSLAFAPRLDGRFSCGAAVNYYHLAIARYGSASAIGLDVGASFAPSPEIMVGGSVTNVNGPRIGACREQLPQFCSAGVAYRPLHDLMLALDIVREPGYTLGVCGGASVEVLGCLSFRAGLSDVPETWSAGCGVALLGVEVDYGVTSHPDLGITHHVSLTLSLEFL